MGAWHARLCWPGWETVPLLPPLGLGTGVLPGPMPVTGLLTEVSTPESIPICDLVGILSWSLLWQPQNTLDASWKLTRPT